jgi:hypothetical protein
MIVPWQQKINSQCIGIAGADGLGKTELAEQLKEYLSIPLVPDGIRGYLDSRKLIMNTLGKRQILKMYLTVLAEKKTIERAATGFIADGTTLDYVSHILALMADDTSLSKPLNDFMVECGIHAAETYDLIFLMPFKRLNMDDDIFRSVCHMLTTQAAMEAQPIVLAYPLKSTLLGDQVAECLEVIDKMNDVKLKVNAEQTGLPVPKEVMN